MQLNKIITILIGIVNLFGVSIYSMEPQNKDDTNKTECEPDQLIIALLRGGNNGFPNLLDVISHMNFPKTYEFQTEWETAGKKKWSFILRDDEEFPFIWR
jgi:hypothetical protein